MKNAIWLAVGFFLLGGFFLLVGAGFVNYLIAGILIGLIAFPSFVVAIVFYLIQKTLE